MEELKVIATKGINEIVSTDRGLILLVKNTKGQTISERSMPIRHFAKLIERGSFTLNHYDSDFLVKSLKYGHSTIEDVICKLG